MFVFIDWTNSKWGGGGSSAMKKRKLNYRFHNPNTAEAAADYILKIMIEANKGKVDQVIANASLEAEQEENGEAYSV